MANSVYPVGSIHRNQSLWDRLPRQQGKMPEISINEQICNAAKLIGFIAFGYLLVGGSAYAVFQIVRWIFQ